MGKRLHADEVDVDDALVGVLIADQHPRLTGLPVRRIASTGTDHAVFRLGNDLVARLPRIGWAEQQVEREATWLPVLAPHLAADVPVPVAVGEPGLGYPFRWMVSPWLPGSDLLAAMSDAVARDDAVIARDIAGLLHALRAVDPSGGPVPGKRARDLAVHDWVVRAHIADLAGEIDAGRALEVWDAALTAEPWSGPPVWVHGDLLPGNVILRAGRIRGVIDWGSTGIGDPACDLMIAWSLSPEARSHLRTELAVDDATWTRTCGWVIEQAVAFIPYYEATLPEAVTVTRARLAAVLAEGND